MIDTNINPNETLSTISVDCVIFGYFENELSVLIRKEDVPLDGKIVEEWKLPGNHIRRNEDINATAARILKEQTGLEDIYVKQFFVFSDPDRLKRRPQDFEWVKPRLEDERVITVGFYSLINISSIDNTKLIDVAKWANANEQIELMFDHNEIFTEALKKLRYDLLHEPLIFELLPQKFTLTQMQKVYEVIFNTLYDKRNFRRKINKMPYLIQLDEIQTNVSHKPARYFCFNRDIYEKSRTERFDFRV
ncbi:MAG TPA: NUDIX domain-containing protein [Paludibacter sp.]|nr:NUDIX domain-containing protein [Paludibacter sp.]